MSAEHARLRQLVLSIEELEGAERDEATEHLTLCEPCRDHLSQLQTAERQGLGMREIPLDANLDDLTAVQEQQSLERLRRRVQPERTAVPWRRLLVPVAMAATLAMVLLRTAPSPIGMVDLVPAARERSTELGWSVGDAVVVEFELRREAYPFLIYVDAEGEPTLLHPQDRQWVVFAPGSHRLPAESARESWILDGPGEDLTFLLGVSRGADLDLDDLAQRLVTAARAHRDREEGILAIRSLLESQGAAVERRDLRVK